MFEEFCFKVYEYLLNIHYKTFELYLKLFGHKIIDYTRFYYFEYGNRYIIYNGDYNNLSFINNFKLLNRIDNLVYYENDNKTIFKFNIRKNIIENYSVVAKEIAENYLTNFDLDKFLNSLDEDELAYVKEKYNRLGV